MSVVNIIHKDILERSIKKNFTYLNRMGDSTHEFDYKYKKSNIPVLNDFYFVVSKCFNYKNSSLVDFCKNVYVYDSQGNYLGGKEVIEEYPDFFKSLEDLK